MRALAASLLSALRAEHPNLVLLVEIDTGLAATPTLRYCSRPYSVAWNGQTWVGRDFNPGEIRIESQDNADGPTLEIADVDRTLRTLLAAGAPFVGEEVILRLTTEELCLTGSAEDTAVRDDFIVDSWETPEGIFRLALKPFAAVFDIAIPRSTLTRDLFPGIPRDATLL